MKIVKLSLQDFARPSPRRGSIEPGSNPGTTLEKGSELHKELQDLRQAEDPTYQAEVPISAVFESGDYRFEVSGRMDGLFSGPRPRIEEIKSSFNIFDLAKLIKDRRFDHPYFVQLVGYGLCYHRIHKVKPELAFLLVSSRRKETQSFDVYWDLQEAEAWLERRLAELEEDAVLSEQRLRRRLKLGRALPFPFAAPRPGQLELMASIETGMARGKKMMLQAPTGLGKTIGVLYPTLKEALARGQRVIYLTPKNSQQAVAEEAVEKLQTPGAPAKSLTITAKSKLCLKAEPLCNPEYCEYARDYYDKLRIHDLGGELRKRKRLTAKVMRNLAEKYEVCPFELQFEAVPEADVVVCDYNYVFGHRSALGKISASGFAQEGLANLVIDEAHNLPARTMGNYSPELSGKFLEGLREDFLALPLEFRRRGVDLLDECLATLRAAAPDKIETRAVAPDFEGFAVVGDELRAFLNEYLESDIEIKPRDVVLRLVFYWGEFTELLQEISIGQSEFFITGQNDGRYSTIKITCCDASKLIRDRYERFEHLVLFSATLKPFEYYAKLSGLGDVDLWTEEFRSPFSPTHRKVLIIPQISTRYSEREKNYPRIADAMARITNLRSGNYLAFFPSFDFLEKVLNRFVAPHGMRILKQHRAMQNDEVEATLDRLRAKTEPVLLFAVQGGVFSEGVDYPGDMVIGAFVIGPPLPAFDFERERMRDYYQREYQAGQDYAYIVPAMAKAIQAAGRVIRTESDKGVIILMDNRFLDVSYARALPADWFHETPGELVSRSILRDLGDFWSQHHGQSVTMGELPISRCSTINGKDEDRPHY